MKRLLCLIMTLMLLPVVPALAEDSAAGALEWEELLTWANSYKARALKEQPLNDPTAPEAYSEDGYAFIYEFATLYMDRPEMTEDSVLKNLVIVSAEEEAPRGTKVDMFTSDVLAAYYNENENLAGDRGFAALYLSNTMPMGAMWGWVQRDGQRIMAIQYAVHDQLASGGDGYTDAGLLYTIQENMVAAIRAYGLDVVIDEADVLDNLSAVEDVMGQTAYTQVPVSYIGTDLTPFQESDLAFAGIDFLTLTPESAQAAFGAPREDQWMEDDTGEYIRAMEFAQCELTFVYDKNKENPALYAMSILADGIEGPRCVRIGDSFPSVLNRFRYNEGQYDDATMTEVLYGTAGSDTCGTAEYSEDGSATLRYTLRAASGQAVVLHMNFSYMSLNEIMLYFTH